MSGRIPKRGRGGDERYSGRLIFNMERVRGPLVMLARKKLIMVGNCSLWEGETFWHGMWGCWRCMGGAAHEVGRGLVA